MLRPSQIVACPSGLLRLEEGYGRLPSDDDEFSRLLFWAGLKLYFKSRK